MFKREVWVPIGARCSGRLVAALAVSTGLALLAAFGAVPAAARHDVRGGQTGAREHRSAALGGCNRTSITGRTNNGTGQPLFLVGATHGFTNTWCSRPSDNVPAHTSNSWKAGDDFFGTEIEVQYHGPRASLGGNGIRVVFFARTGTPFNKHPSASCKFLAEPVRPFLCVADLTGGNGHHPRVLFGVFPKAKSTSQGQCKHDGWKNFGAMFKNHGACASFVVHQRHKHHPRSG